MVTSGGYTRPWSCCAKVPAVTPGLYYKLGKYCWSEYVRPVFYDWLGEVPKLLLSVTPGALASTTPTHQQRLHVEATMRAQPYGNHDGKGQQKHIDDRPQERITDGKQAEAVTSSGDHEEENDETRVNAAKVIQDAYRRYLDRK